jgi:hypothetical protein
MATRRSNGQWKMTVADASSPPPTPAVIGQGLAVWLGYQAVRKSKRPFRWTFRQFRQALFGWKDYNKYLREQSVVEGVFNGRKAWLAVGAVVWGLRALRRAAGHTEHVVLSEALQAGDQLIITQAPRKPSRSQRKAAKAS